MFVTSYPEKVLQFVLKNDGLRPLRGDLFRIILREHSWSVYYCDRSCKPEKLAAAAILPMAADVILTNIGFYQYSLWIACGSGIIFGFIIAILIQYTLSKKENSEV